MSVAPSLSTVAPEISISTEGPAVMVKRSLARFGSQPPAPERKGPVTVSVHRNRSLSDAGQRSPKSKRDYVITDHRPKMDLRESWFRKSCLPSRFNPLHASLIDDHLIIGGREAASHLELLRYYGVTHILNVSAQVPNYFEDHFLYCNISLIDTETEAVRPHLRRAFEFLNDALRVNGRVLVHCVAGVSRSVTIAVAYLMYRKKLWLRDVLKLVQKKRHIAHPNDGFLLELANLELELLGASSVATVKDKIWDFVEWNKKRRKVKVAPERPKSCVVM